MPGQPYPSAPQPPPGQGFPPGYGYPPPGQAGPRPGPNQGYAHPPAPPPAPPQGYPPQNPGPQGYPPAGQGYPPPPAQGYPRPGPQGQPPYPGAPQGQPPYGAPIPPPPPVPPAPWQPPQRRSGGAGVIVVSVFGVIALLFIGLVVAGSIIKNRYRDSAPHFAVPTYTPSPLETSRPATEDTPTPTPTETPQETKPTDVPSPSKEVVRNTTLEGNTLYRTGGLPTVSCSAGSPSIYSHSQLKGLILKTSKCLDKGWSRILGEQGIDWSPPGYAIVSGRGRGACGDFPQIGSIVPYYCPRNHTIYASTGAMAKGSGNSLGYGQIVGWHGAIISMMAHEYGHHVQQLTGLSDSWWQKTQRSSSRSGRLALSRRFELQATCFGGMFMRSVASTYPVTPARRNTLYYFYSRVGDWPGYPRDHGTPANNNRWFRQGYEKNKTFQCNTWLASSSSTS
ncbi:neutral zinc metallopeptidase [Streptosporangium sp. NPDC020145]|uniref:neutral zinc metallopeptidase n=1 Tax=Streptosporangium sp. NPDC020145 TaxID=3154694 RepID=UPI0034370588